MSLLVSYMCVLDNKSCKQGGQKQTYTPYHLFNMLFVHILMYLYLQGAYGQLNDTFGVLHVYV